MKKILRKIEPKNEKVLTTTPDTNNFVGKVFNVGKTSVTVEEILAEGEHNLQKHSIHRRIVNFACFKSSLLFMMSFKCSTFSSHSHNITHRLILTLVLINFFFLLLHFTVFLFCFKNVYLFLSSNFCRWLFNCFSGKSRQWHKICSQKDVCQ